jgi:hypothetical protein
VAAEGEHKHEYSADLYLDGALVRSRHPVCVVRYSKGQYITGATGDKGCVPRSVLLQGMAWGPGRKALVALGQQLATSFQDCSLYGQAAGHERRRLSERGG